MLSSRKQVGQARLKILTVIGLFSGDILLARYLWLKFSDREMFKRFLNIAIDLITNDRPLLLPQNFEEEFYRSLTTTLTFILGFYLFIHFLVIALNFFSGKSFRRYLMLVCLTYCLGFIYLAFSGNMSSVFKISFVFQALVYLMIGVALKKNLLKQNGFRSVESSQED